MPSVMSRMKNSVIASRGRRVKKQRHRVEGVDAGGDDDVQLGDRLRDPLDPRDVPALADGGDVDDRGDAVRRQLAQAADGVGDPLVLVTPFLGVVLLHFGGEHENVLVHKYPAEAGGLHRAARRLDLRH